MGPTAAGRHPANLREANLQAKPTPRGGQDLEGYRGTVLPLPYPELFYEVDLQCITLV